MRLSLIHIYTQEVANHLVAAVGEHALGMELNALNRQGAVTEAHDHRPGACGLRRASRDGEHGRERLFFNDEGVVASAGERGGQAGEDAFAVVLDGAGFAVHERARADHLAAESFTDRLVSQTDAEDGRLAGHVADERDENAGLMRRAGARRKQNALRLESLDLLDCQFVIAIDRDLCTQFPKVLDKVVRKRIVIVEDKDHGELQCSALRRGVYNSSVFEIARK